MNIINRIHKDIVDLDYDNVREFWDNRAKIEGLNSVLLGKQDTQEENLMLNTKEKNNLMQMLGNSKKSLKILDIGCGIGRWAENFADIIESYDGIDYVESFINNNRIKFKDYKNIRFYQMNIENIDKSVLSNQYNCIIITGVLMYLNDESLGNVFNTLSLFDSENIYLQESVSKTEARLSLKDFYSNELKANYNAIYRTKEEYEKYINKYLPDYNIKYNNMLYSGNSETGRMYWFLDKRRLNDFR